MTQNKRSFQRILGIFKCTRDVTQTSDLPLLNNYLWRKSNPINRIPNNIDMKRIKAKEQGKNKMKMCIGTRYKKN